MFNTDQNNKIVQVLSVSERRHRRTPREIIAIIQQTMGSSMTMSHVELSAACLVEAIMSKFEFWRINELPY